jgi:hypothetical protein
MIKRKVNKMRCFNCQKINGLTPSSKERLKRCGVCNYKGRLSGCVLKTVGRPYIIPQPNKIGETTHIARVYVIAQCKVCNDKESCEKQFVMSKGSE